MSTQPVAGPHYRVGARPATRTLGGRLAAAIAARDAEALGELFTTLVEFRAVTPSRFWEAENPAEVVAIVLDTWFDPTKQITDLTFVEDGRVGDVRRIGYRMAVTTGSGPTVIEQIAFYTERDDRIARLRLVCSGFQPV